MGVFEPIVTPGLVTNVGCNYTQTWRANYTDACGNAAVEAVITYTWIVDTEIPVISTEASSGALTCNPVVVGLYYGYG